MKFTSKLFFQKLLRSAKNELFIKKNHNSFQSLHKICVLLLCFVLLSAEKMKSIIVLCCVTRKYKPPFSQTYVCEIHVTKFFNLNSFSYLPPLPLFTFRQITFYFLPLTHTFITPVCLRFVVKFKQKEKQ
jgi:hypothetical protein